jgi:hypothetical protein
MVLCVNPSAPEGLIAGILGQSGIRNHPETTGIEQKIIIPN